LDLLDKLNVLKQIDINCDLGEVLLSSGFNIDAELIPYVSSCNISTGGHAGDEETMKHAMLFAKKHNVAVGAHPSYPDRENFGRRSLDMPSEELYDSLYEQVFRFIKVAEYLGVNVHHVKPHGALYNDMVKDREKAEIVISLIKEIDPHLQLYGLANSGIENLAAKENITFRHEVFADRAYENVHALRNRKLNGSVISDIRLIEKQLSKVLLDGVIRLYDDTLVPTKADTICVHSDTENCKEILKKITAYLKHNNIHVSPT